MRELYLSNKKLSNGESKYFLVASTNEKVECSICKNRLVYGDVFFIHNSYSKRDFIKKIYCIGCIKKHKKMIVDEFIITELTYITPPNSTLIIDSPPSLKVSTSVYDSALSNRNISADTGSAEIIDRTRFANKPEFNKLDMSDGQIKTDLHKLDREVSLNKGLDILDEIASAKPIENTPEIENKEVKLLK